MALDFLLETSRVLPANGPAGPYSVTAFHHRLREAPAYDSRLHIGTIGELNELGLNPEFAGRGAYFLARLTMEDALDYESLRSPLGPQAPVPSQLGPGELYLAFFDVIYNHHPADDPTPLEKRYSRNTFEHSELPARVTSEHVPAAVSRLGPKLGEFVAVATFSSDDGRYALSVPLEMNNPEAANFISAGAHSKYRLELAPYR